MSHVHGTYTAYAREGCRCDRCRLWWNARIARTRKERLDSGRVNHGSAGWDDGCRCTVCASAHRERKRAYYLRKKDASS